MIEIVKDGRKKVARDLILLFVDFSKVFDRVNRRILMEILTRRCRSELDRKCCNLIGVMLNGTANEYCS